MNICLFFTDDEGLQHCYSVRLLINDNNTTNEEYDYSEPMEVLLLIVRSVCPSVVLFC